MKSFKIILLALAAFSFGGCVSAPAYRTVPEGAPAPQVIYVREYAPYYYAPYPYPVFSWHFYYGHGRR